MMNGTSAEPSSPKKRRFQGLWRLSTFLVILFAVVLGFVVFVNWNYIYGEISKNPDIAKHAVLVLGLLILIIGSVSVLINDGESRARKWITDLEIADKELNLKFSDEVKGASQSQERLKQQLEIIRYRAKHHFDIMSYFYVRYYMAITTFSIAAMLAAIALLFIGKKGLDDVNPYVLTSFIVLTGSAAFFGAFPNIFRQNQNIADNKALYIQHINLEQEVISYAATGEAITGKTVELDKYIHYVDQQLAKFHNIAVGFDYTKVPSYANVFNMPQDPGQ